MSIFDCNYATHGEHIRSILNQAILNTTARYDLEPLDEEAFRSWFEHKIQCQYPILGINDELGSFAGFATYGSFRDMAAYRYTVEHSVYVAESARGKGLASALLCGLIARAISQRLHVMVGVIDSNNDASMALHRKFGFTYAGSLKEVGHKFSRWLDVDFYEMILPEVTPTA